MRVVRHWIREKASATDDRGEVHWGAAWGWSETHVAEARQRATAAAERVAQWRAGGRQGVPPSERRQYSYLLDRPAREEIVQELFDADGQTTGLITRNAYGALVLNTRDLMFVDVDFPRPTGAGGFFQRLFGRAPKPPDVAADAVARVRQWCSANPERSVRVYRTAAGLRIAVVDRPIEPNGDEARRILEELGSDPLYRQLCAAQECFRARLTPKPWRMKSVGALSPPPARFPFDDPAAEESYRDWLHEYDAAAMQFATCRLLESQGPGAMPESLASLIALHDSLTGVESSRDLA
jgi:hypothetical protein